jgi:hypothetical protein
MDGANKPGAEALDFLEGGRALGPNNSSLKPNPCCNRFSSRPGNFLKLQVIGRTRGQKRDILLPFSVRRRPRRAILRDISTLQRFASGRDYLPSPSSLLQRRWSSGLAAQEAGQAADFLSPPSSTLSSTFQSLASPGVTQQPSGPISASTPHAARRHRHQPFPRPWLLPAGPCGMPSNLAWDFPSGAGYRAFGSMAEELNLCAGWSEGAFPGQPAGALWLLSCAQ